MTDYNWMPQRFRKIALQIAGIGYDRYMISRYIDKIRDIVDVVRVRTQNGDIVLVNEPDVLDLAIKKIAELGSDPMSDDLLVTFARLSLFMDPWTSIMARVSVKADESKDYSQAYPNLFMRMQKAEDRAKTLGPLPYAFAEMTHYRLLAMQLAYLIAPTVEEAVRHSPWLRSFLPF
jgi:hypothetical protein